MSIASGPVVQVAWVTDDIARTESMLFEQFGTGTWTRIPDVHFDREHSQLRGVPTEFTAHVSLAHAGELQLELIEPVAGAPYIGLARIGPQMHAFFEAVRRG